MDKLNIASDNFIARSKASLRPISKTEEKVLFYLAHTGYSNKDIAEHFNSSEETIKQHMLALFDKTGCGSRTELVIMVWRKRYQELEHTIKKVA